VLIGKMAVLLLLASTVTREPQERLPGVTLTAETLTTDSGRQIRGVFSRPTGQRGRLPGALLVGWLSCDPVEAPVDGEEDGFARILHAIAEKSGFVFLRVEKPGITAGETPRCEDNDFQTDLAAHQAGLKALAARPDVDPTRIFLVGLSLGGGVAPLVARDVPVAGYVVSGAWAKTWLEHMLELERRRLALSGASPGDVSQALIGFADFYALYLNGRMTPGEVLKTRPDLKPLWYDEPGRQYGRAAPFFHQLQSLNVARAWQEVRVPVLAVYGQHDWIMSRDDHELIVEWVNRNKPGLATLVEVPQMDHFYMSHRTPEEAFRDEPKGRYADKAERTILDWLLAKAAPPKAP
jgi:pimeloyl-ACP methyl ester carboxylesterase